MALLTQVGSKRKDIAQVDGMEVGSTQVGSASYLRFTQVGRIVLHCDVGSENSRQERSVSCRVVSACDICLAVGRFSGEKSIMAESSRKKFLCHTPRLFIFGSFTALIVAPNA